MHIAHVIRDLDRSSGGPSRSVPALANALALRQDVSCTVFCQDFGSSVVVPRRRDLVRYVFAPGKGIRGAVRLRDRLEQTHRQQAIEVLHLHGLWSPAIHFAATFARKHRIPYVVSPRGMLSPWCFNSKRSRKLIGWWAYQRRDLQLAACIHATSDQEAGDVSSARIQRPRAVIPNGCDGPPQPFQSTDLLSGSSHASSQTRWAISIGRLHPVKGFAELIEAWAIVRPANWKLAIVGPDETGYRRELEALARNRELTSDVLFIDQVDDATKWSLLHEAELFLLASHSENFGMSIAEALVCGTPTIVTRGTPWESINEARCGWWVAMDIAALGSAISNACQMSADSLSEMGQRGRSFINANYGWTSVAARTMEMYRGITHPSEIPPDVRLRPDQHSPAVRLTQS